MEFLLVATSNILSKYGKKLIRDRLFSYIKKTFFFTKNSYGSKRHLPGNYCESVIPDPIPNSAVKPFSANGTLS